jgi:hypothetical protein
MRVSKLTSRLEEALHDQHVAQQKHLETGRQCQLSPWCRFQAAELRSNKRQRETWPTTKRKRRAPRRMRSRPSAEEGPAQASDPAKQGNGVSKRQHVQPRTRGCGVEHGVGQSHRRRVRPRERNHLGGNANARIRIKSFGKQARRKQGLAHSVVRGGVFAVAADAHGDHRVRGYNRQIAAKSQVHPSSWCRRRMSWSRVWQRPDATCACRLQQPTTLSTRSSASTQEQIHRDCWAPWSFCGWRTSVARWTRRCSGR